MIDKQKITLSRKENSVKEYIIICHFLEALLRLDLTIYFGVRPSFQTSSWFGADIDKPITDTKTTKMDYCNNFTQSFPGFMVPPESSMRCQRSRLIQSKSHWRCANPSLYLDQTPSQVSPSP